MNLEKSLRMLPNHYVYVALFLLQRVHAGFETLVNPFTGAAASAWEAVASRNAAAQSRREQSESLAAASASCKSHLSSLCMPGTASSRGIPLKITAWRVFMSSTLVLLDLAIHRKYTLCRSLLHAGWKDSTERLKQYHVRSMATAALRTQRRLSQPLLQFLHIRHPEPLIVIYHCRTAISAWSPISRNTLSQMERSRRNVTMTWTRSYPSL